MLRRLTAPRQKVRHAEGGPGAPFRSGSVSRILSWTTIHLVPPFGGRGRLAPTSCGLPGSSRAGSTILFGLAPDGVCLAAASPRRRCALTAPFHLCLCATHVWSRHRPCVSVALSRGFPRVGVTHRPALWCPDFPRRVFSPPAAVRPTKTMIRPTVLQVRWARRWESGFRPSGSRRSPGRPARHRWSGSAPSPHSRAGAEGGLPRGTAS